MSIMIINDETRMKDVPSVLAYYKKLYHFLNVAVAKKDKGMEKQYRKSIAEIDEILALQGVIIFQDGGNEWCMYSLHCCQCNKQVNATNAVKLDNGDYLCKEHTK